MTCQANKFSKSPIAIGFNLIHFYPSMSSNCCFNVLNCNFNIFGGQLTLYEFGYCVTQFLRLLESDKNIAWENSWHFAMSTTVSWGNDINLRNERSVTTLIWIVLLTGWKFASISTLNPETLFHRATIGRAEKCWLLSQATKNIDDEEVVSYPGWIESTVSIRAVPPFLAE